MIAYLLEKQMFFNEKEANFFAPHLNYCATLIDTPIYLE